jgi:hypothetical protein
LIKALLLVATLQDPIGYDSMKMCETAAKKLNDFEGAEIAVCIPAGKSQQDMMFDKFLGIIENMSKIDKKSVDKEGN